jgi:hypothetical protein
VKTRKLLSFLFVMVCASAWPQNTRWSEQRANDWYARQPWLVGSNYIPRDAINELEMWQEATFDPDQIDKELGWAESLGMNTMRVFLHDLLWQDPQGFRKRLEQFLAIASRHHIRPLLVLFDSCWDPLPQLVVGAFANDDRILGWDVWNEPSSDQTGNYPKTELKMSEKIARVAVLLPQAFAWAREMNPTQPLTSGVYEIDLSQDENAQDEIERIQLRESDVITFHNYSWPESFKKEIAWLRRFHRPIICTEYMARSVGSTFDTILPIAKQEHVAAINWGFVAGKTQTYYPWESWQHPYILRDPPVWFHEVLRSDGTPYRQAEVDLIRQLTGGGKLSTTPR